MKLRELITIKVKLTHACGRLLLVHNGAILAYLDDVSQAVDIINHPESVFILERDYSDSTLVRTFDYEVEKKKLAETSGVYLDNMLTIAGIKVRPLIYLNPLGNIKLALDLEEASAITFYQFENKGAFAVHLGGEQYVLDNEEVLKIKEEIDKKFGMLIKYEIQQNNK